MNKTELLDRIGALGDDRILLAHVLDRAQQAQQRNIPAATDFLSPQQQAQSQDLLRLAGFSANSYCFFGGYEGAERTVAFFLPDWLEAESVQDECPLKVLRATFRAEEKLNHRDFLGSLMGMGIVREKLGDILVGPDSADLIVSDSIADFLLQSWCSAGRAKLAVKAIAPEHIHIPTANVQEIHDTVSSLRLDAVCSTGFRMARGKASDLIASGRVQVNWRECTKPDKLLAAGDTVSARGFGKFELTEVGNLTKKGRISITVKRYL